MTPQRWQQVKNTLAEALEQGDTAARVALLDARCADDTGLRREVESLLAQPDDPFVGYANSGGLLQAPQAESVGRRIGAYELVREIGRGGMGTVWLARRADREFHQEVAIKLLKRGTDTDEVLRRFRTEREILARLEHPNIARLLDGGTTDDGLPYLVMEHVVGTLITEYVAAKALSIAERLRLFLKVCSAVQFAHQNLVVHRDLKPGNILVTAQGEPKLLDFGIAKLIAPDESTIEITAPERQRLTPGYASPEQVRGESVTTLSDVYSLGAILYELLTGQSPHHFATQRPSPTELMRAIVEEEPQRPSVVASDRELRRQLAPDLETIVLTAIRKEPALRYRGVGSLADDLRRFLDDWPIRARPASVAYRARKFLQRNKTLTTAAGLLLVTLIAGIAATARQAQIARQERARADRRFNELRGFANLFLFEVDEAIAEHPTQARKILVGLARQYLDGLSAEAVDDLSLQRELAVAYEKLGDVGSQLHKANLGDSAGALESYRRALALRESLFAAASSATDRDRLRLDLARSYRRLGDILAKTGDTTAALAHYNKTIPLLEEKTAGTLTHAENLELASSYEIVGRALLRAGKMDQAVQRYEHALRILDPLALENPRDSAPRLEQMKTYNSLGYVLAEMGRKHDALDLYRKSLALIEPLAAADPANALLRRQLMNYEGWVGIGLRDCDDLAGALAQFQSARALCEDALREDAANMQARNDLADVEWNIGRTLFLQGEAAGALDHYQRAAENYRAVANADRLNVHAQRQVWSAEMEAGRALALHGQSSAAVDKLRECLTQFERLVAQDPTNTEFQRDLARCNAALADLLVAQGHSAEALAHLRAALPLFEQIAAHWQMSVPAREDLARATSALSALDQSSR